MQKGHPKTTVSFPISVWYSDETGHIHIARPTADGFITTVNGDPNSARGHVHLYRKLAEALHSAGALAPATRLRLEKD